MSGTKNCPETPRQKMIGMMYLVLIAMMALNVSSEILNGFKLVDDSLHNSIVAIEEQNNRLYQEFSAMYEQNPQNVKVWLDKAIQLRTNANDLFQYIHRFKIDLLVMADDENADTVYARTIERREDLNVATRYGITQGNATILKGKIETYRNLLISFTDNELVRNEIQNLFNTSDINNKSWELAIFENMPVSAIITILTKYQNDIRNTESKMIQYLKARTEQGGVRVNQFSAFVIPESNYVLEGQEYRAQIVLAAIDTTQRPVVYVNNTRLGPNNEFRITAGRAGMYEYSGFIELPIPGQAQPERLPFTQRYQVGRPVAVISNEDLNVLYRGFENRINVSATGIPADNLRIAVNGGTATPQGNGRFIVSPTANSVQITVTGTIGDRTVNLGSNTYRVKQLPDPRPYAVFRDANGNTRTIFEGGVHGPSFIAGSPSVTAGYGEDALVQANFTVISFVIRSGRRTYPSNGSRFSQEQIDFIRGLPSGTPITIQRIRATGPDGVERNLSAVALEIL